MRTQLMMMFLLQLGDLSNPELRILTEQLDKIRYGGWYTHQLFGIVNIVIEYIYYLTIK